ncbi:MAG: DNA-binding protein [Nostocaceae cyanobacterium]|nr:DNA-binding protein [Nostocaceae cyanobacterium]
MKILAIRLKPEADLKQSLKEFSLQKDIKSGFILTAVGSLKQANIRFANEENSKVLQEEFEIISLNGTLSTSGLHLHIAIADKNGQIIGGHVNDGCIIYTTAEIVIGTTEEFTFLRNFDEQTGYQELEIKVMGNG